MTQALSLYAILAGMLAVAGGIILAALVIEFVSTLMTASLLEPSNDDDIEALGSAVDKLWDKLLKQMEHDESRASVSRYWLPTFRILRKTDQRIFSTLASRLPLYQRRRVNAYLKATGIVELLRTVQAGTPIPLIARALKKANKAISNSVENLGWFGKKATKWVKSAADTKADLLENFVEGKADADTGSAASSGTPSTLNA
jgi:hypothetical protein